MQSFDTDELSGDDDDVNNDDDDDEDNDDDDEDDNVDDDDVDDDNDEDNECDACFLHDVSMGGISRRPRILPMKQVSFPTVIKLAFLLMRLYCAFILVDDNDTSSDCFAVSAFKADKIAFVLRG